MAKGEKRQGEKQHSEKAVRKVTAAESEAVRKHHLARLKGKPSVRFTVAAEDNHWVVRLDHPDERIGQCLLADALGSTNSDFVNGLAAQLVNAASPAAQADLTKLNFKLAVIKESGPRDQFETMLVAQMAEVHVASMRSAYELAP